MVAVRAGLVGVPFVGGCRVSIWPVRSDRLVGSWWLVGEMGPMDSALPT